MMKVLITGGSGQVGRALTRTAPASYNVTALNSADCNVADFHSVRGVVDQYGPDLIIHAGAMTNVDGCEREPDLAWRINALGSQNVATAAHTSGAALVYVSTNFVFSGEADEPYHEFDDPAPISVYGRSKLAGERAVQTLCPRHAIVRTAMVFDETGQNFVNTMLRLAEAHPTLRVVGDQYGNPTYAADLADAIWQLAGLSAFGTFHLTNEGVTSWHGWAVETLHQAGAETPVESIPASSYKRDARPPRNGALANTAAAALGITLPNWTNALQRCLQRRSTLSEIA